MDNVRFHHSNPEFYEYPYEIKYLPRYSPFLNPCEEAFSLIKNQVRRDSRPTGANDLIRRMRSACATANVQNESSATLGALFSVGSWGRITTADNQCGCIGSRAPID
ncbi:hypothetical protein RF11_11781 [Thelohanellus kitauei]|uniref:Tc1-like transposase DDE domain-containing protein n=1 Tax=Thelohanellus kitauei TaxID=669202 RepID=A0A0C2M102_THEKT|nr:hypothetical protein RF11_11781 [Thelohanellus kitauei]